MISQAAKQRPLAVFGLLSFLIVAAVGLVLSLLIQNAIQARPVETASDTRSLWVAMGFGLAILYGAIFQLVQMGSRKLRNHAEANLHLANHDSLTDLLNRDSFLKAVERQRTDKHRHIEMEGPVTYVILLNLDRFEKISQSLGQPLAEELLRVVGQRLKLASGERGVVARIEGDQFGVLLAKTEPGKVLDNVDRFSSAISTPIELDGIGMEISASFGLAEVGSNGCDVVLRQAQLALSTSRSNNTSVEHFRPELDHHRPEDLELVREVRDGIKNQQFEVYYQPAYDLATGAVTSCEGLVRWRHRTRGLLPPLTFLPMVQQLPVCRELTNYVLERAIRDVSKWQDEWPDIGVSVNLAPCDVNDTNLPLEIEALLRRYRVKPELLTVEVTEGTVHEDKNRSAATLSRIRHLGCGIAIDDFGPGQASIGHLLSLPVTRLKIDISFVRDIDTNPRSNRVVRSFIDVAHSLGLETIAEGIETDAVETELRLMNCDQGQGFFVSRPVPYEDFVVFLRQSNNRIVPPIQKIVPPIQKPAHAPAPR